METIEFFLVFLLGIAVGYIWRHYISQARARVRHELREEKRLNALASSIDLPAFLSRPPDAHSAIADLRSFCKGLSRMPDTKRPWSEDDIAKLKSMAGKFPTKEIAAELGRSVGATVVEASKLKVSLRTRPHFGGPRRVSIDVSTI
jgi:hypothetical protein